MSERTPTGDLPGQIQAPWEFLRPIARDLGFAAVGTAVLEPIPSVAAERYQSWINNRFHAEMSYMEKYRSQRLDPRNPKVLAGATTLIAVALPYGQGAFDLGLWRHVALHARGRDYHHTMRKRLADIARAVVSRFEGCKTRIFVDTAPLMERTWAVRAGLGGIGRNGALVVPGIGCRVLLGEILVSGAPPPSFNTNSLPFDPCTDCDICLSRCPTGAIVSPAVVDSRRCISYHTIENRSGAVPEEVASKMSLVFGCDECTSVCRLEVDTGVCGLEPPLNRGPSELSLQEIAEMHESDLETLIAETALERTGAEAIQRNARAILYYRGSE